MLVGYQTVLPHFRWLWKSSCQAKHKFFFWLLLHDRLNTRNLLSRKRFHIPSFNCAILQCNQEETLMHLFWTCPFASQCWDYVCPQRSRGLSVHEAFLDLKTKLKVPFFMEIMVLAAWGIWIVRNNKIFEGCQPSFRNWRTIYLQELKLVGHRIKHKYAQEFKVWLQQQSD